MKYANEYEAIVALRDALKDALDNCLWSSDMHLQPKEESQRLFNKTVEVLEATETFQFEWWKYEKKEDK